jgi:hypothetical protein
MRQWKTEKKSNIYPVRGDSRAVYPSVESEVRYMGQCNMPYCTDAAVFVTYVDESIDLRICSRHAEQLHKELTTFFYGEEFAEFVQKTWKEQVSKRLV